MKEYTKNLIFRISTSVACLMSMALSVYLFVLCFLNESETSTWFQMVAIGVCFVFALTELIIVLKNIKKELLIEYVIFNENKSINKVGLSIVIIFTLLSLGLSIMCIVFMCGVAWSSDAYYASVVILSCTFFLFVNCILYYLYILLFRLRKFGIDDYHKVQDTKIQKPKK